MKPSESAAWLAIEGWCTPEEGDALCEAAAQVGDWIVEIGTGMGKSAIAMAMSGRVVTTFDNDRDRLDAASIYAERNKVRIKIGYGDSRGFATWYEGQISFLYIDGWHDSENVRADYAAWAPHVVPDGLIWFHDAHGAGWPDVTALVDELVSKGELIFDGHVGTIAKCRKAGA